MIISHEHKFIFLKTRKTAGTSIEISLSQLCGEEDIITPIDGQDEEFRRELGHRGPQNFRMPSSKRIPKDGRPRRKVDFYNHIPAERIRVLAGTEVWDEYFKFCFERNPWDKAISMYSWLTRGLKSRPSLLDFLRSEEERLHSEGKSSKLSNFGIYSIGGDVTVDRVALYEDLDSELERIAALLDLPEKMDLPRAKGAAREDRRHYGEVMGREERDIVARVCAREIAHFGHAF